MQCETYRNYCVLQWVLLAGVSVFKERRVMTTRRCLPRFRAQPSLKMIMLHVLGVKMCNNASFWHTANEKCYVARSESAKVPRQIKTLFKSTSFYRSKRV